MNSKVTCWLGSRHQIFPKDSCRLIKAWGLERQELFDVSFEIYSNDMVLTSSPEKANPPTPGLIAGIVLFGKHALMEDTGNQNTGELLAIKHDVLTMLHSAQAWANVVARSS